MTYARQERDEVIVQITQYDVDYYLKPLHLLEEAQRKYEAVLSDLPTSELHDFHDDVQAAEADVEELFQERLTIEAAERLHHQLGAAIVRARVARGDYEYERSEDQWPNR